MKDSGQMAVQIVKRILTIDDLEELAAIPTFEHKCNNCGGTVEMDIDNHIFRCPYCGSVYAVGVKMINDKTI